ncbi:MAG: hypothetical protein JWQ81_6674 [Amycolatopsis sp.]|jgi:hypothetical protein|uniref:hypothetical protein n=1 Tax=Amycolatopsis sp. TaxID=37632 RepID=UPI002631BB61|nr:hypothetical protein [Amycolatopsis sp.]MCU1685935.1 hypothetical protein [Amycolatopsis sp.]
MSDRSADTDAELLRTLQEIDEAVAQVAAWTAERDALIRKAESLGGSGRQTRSRSGLPPADGSDANGHEHGVSGWDTNLG